MRCLLPLASLCTVLGTTPVLADSAKHATPRLFAPGVISSDANETTATFTPDGKTVYFTRSDAYSVDNTIFESHRSGGGWSEPVVAAFSGQWRDSEPHVSPDGKRLVFVSNRPVLAGGEPLMTTSRGTPHPGANLWYVERRGDGWGPPVHLEGPINATPKVYNPSLARDGTLYFSGNLADDPDKSQIYRARWVQGQYAAPVRLPFSDIRWSHMDPTIDPDQRFMVFAAARPDSSGSADLYIVFRDARDRWSEPEWLGAEVNSPGLENAPVLAPDGKTLYFSSTRSSVAGHFPKPREDAAQAAARLHGPENGLRNLWTIDLSPWLAGRVK